MVLVLALPAAMLQPTGCSQRPSDLSLATSDASADHKLIAELHSREAAKLRQMSEELTHRVLVYERLFGPESDWVQGTRLLAQTYEDAAREQDLQADAHLRLAGRQRTSRPDGSAW